MERFQVEEDWGEEQGEDKRVRELEELVSLCGADGLYGGSFYNYEDH